MTKALLFTSGAFILLKKQNNDLRIKDESHPKRKIPSFTPIKKLGVYFKIYRFSAFIVLIPLKHKTEHFLLRSFKPFNLQRKQFLQLSCHKRQKRLVGFFVLTLVQRKDIFFPILFEYLSRKKVITKLNVVHQ